VFEHSSSSSVPPCSTLAPNQLDDDVMRSGCILHIFLNEQRTRPVENRTRRNVKLLVLLRETGKNDTNEWNKVTLTHYSTTITKIGKQ
jgi:hypothetical protein